jgi:hypothetical protein
VGVIKLDHRVALISFWAGYIKPYLQISLRTHYLNFAQVGGFHLQAEPLSVIKFDASSREAGALKVEAIVNYASALITQQMEASGSPDLLGRS